MINIVSIGISFYFINLKKEKNIKIFIKEIKLLTPSIAR